MCDAIHAFDTANLHERGGLDTLGGDVTAGRAFLTARGFTGPLWVTEHGYPADPPYQWDPAYRTGADAQSAYLSASVPSLLDAGASEVFVTERNNLGSAMPPEACSGATSPVPRSMCRSPRWSRRCRRCSRRRCRCRSSPSRPPGTESAVRSRCS